ncbi:hypothetical protein AB3475_12710 [Pantoea agglomerans]
MEKSWDMKRELLSLAYITRD